MSINAAWLSRHLVIVIACLLIIERHESCTKCRWNSAPTALLGVLNPMLYWSMATPGYVLSCPLLLITCATIMQNQPSAGARMIEGLLLGVVVLLVPHSLVMVMVTAFLIGLCDQRSAQLHPVVQTAVLLLPSLFVLLSLWLSSLLHLPLLAFPAFEFNSVSPTPAVGILFAACWGIITYRRWSYWLVPGDNRLLVFRPPRD